MAYIRLMNYGEEVGRIYNGTVKEGRSKAWYLVKSTNDLITIYSNNKKVGFVVRERMSIRKYHSESTGKWYYLYHDGTIKECE